MKIREDRIFSQQVDDEIVLLDLDRSLYYRLNGTGVHLWKQLQDGSSEAEMVDSLVRRYGIGKDASLKDVRKFIGLLKERDLLAE